MATTPATAKQLKFLKTLTGKEYSDEELTASEASNKIGKALANKAKDLPPQPDDKVLPEHQEEIDKAKAEVAKPTTPKSKAEEIEEAQARKAGYIDVAQSRKLVVELLEIKMLIPIFGTKISEALLKELRGFILSSQKVPYDGKDLPDPIIKSSKNKEE